jgi:hypothetical protein
MPVLAYTIFDDDEDSDSTELAEVLPDEASGLQAPNFSG